MADVHPMIVGRHDLPIEERIRDVEILLARLWDQVWWISLSPERRAEYERQGFTAPIEKFYAEGQWPAPR